MTTPVSWLDDEDDDFPGIVLDKISARFELLWGDNIHIELRPLLPTDPNFSIGMFGQGWRPDPTTYEIGSISQTRQATIQRYPVSIQVLVRDTDKVHGIRNSSVFSSKVRRVLADDELLRLSLEGLTVEIDGDKKVLHRFYVDSADDLSGEVGGELVYLSKNNLVIEVEKQ